MAREHIKKSHKIFVCLVLTLGALALVAPFVKSCFDLGKPTIGAVVAFGVGGPLLIGLGSLFVGGVLMLISLCLSFPGGSARWRIAQNDAHDL